MRFREQDSYRLILSIWTRTVCIECFQIKRNQIQHCDRQAVILEIPVQTIAPGYEKASEGERINLTNWLYINENNEPELKYTSYYSVGNGYIFIFPEKWSNKVTIKRDAINDETVFCEYNGDSETNKIGRELLRIYCAEDEASREDRLYTGYIMLRTKGDSSYLAYIPPSSTDDDLYISQTDVAIGFVYKN